MVSSVLFCVLSRFGNSPCDRSPGIRLMAKIWVLFDPWFHYLSVNAENKVIYTKNHSLGD